MATVGEIRGQTLLSNLAHVLLHGRYPIHVFNASPSGIEGWQAACARRLFGPDTMSVGMESEEPVDLEKESKLKRFVMLDKKAMLVLNSVATCHWRRSAAINPAHLAGV